MIDASEVLKLFKDRLLAYHAHALDLKKRAGSEQTRDDLEMQVAIYQNLLLELSKIEAEKLGGEFEMDDNSAIVRVVKLSQIRRRAHEEGEQDQKVKEWVAQLKQEIEAAKKRDKHLKPEDYPALQLDPKIMKSQNLANRLSKLRKRGEVDADITIAAPDGGKELYLIKKP